MTESDLSPAGGEISPELLKKAFKAFKKRLTAVRPPDQYPLAVWDELVRQGKLKDAGYGLYELPRKA